LTDGRPQLNGRRLLVVHAHPDDESIFTGVTMAKYAAEGSGVTLVTATMGGGGSIRRKHPAAKVPVAGEDRQEMLRKLRAEELDAACAALGVTDHRYLGGQGRWRDYGPGASGPSDFWRAKVDDVARELAAVIRETAPQVIVTYDVNGFYGHPDHIQAYRAAWRAYELACEPKQAKFYALTMPRSVAAAAAAPRDPAAPVAAGTAQTAPPNFLLMGAVPDEQVTTEIDGTAYLGAKLAALEAHATQIAVEGTSFRATGLGRVPVLGTEYYSLLAGPAMAAGPPACREDDLFRGL
jgi:N-acetyl-1-D-myo-inositol-2-amino-2-deoxy-alpha-D-glucopyranoside deacetylase